MKYIVRYNHCSKKQSKCIFVLCCALEFVVLLSINQKLAHNSLLLSLTTSIFHFQVKVDETQWTIFISHVVFRIIVITFIIVSHIKVKLIFETRKMKIPTQFRTNLVVKVLIIFSKLQPKLEPVYHRNSQSNVSQC